MPDDRLANTTVRTLSEYLVARQRTGTVEPRLEELRRQVEVKMSDVCATQTFARFVNKPDGNLEANMLRQQLIDAIAADPEFATTLALALTGGAGLIGRATDIECPP